MRYRITHSTQEGGDEPVSVGHNEARLCPRILEHQVRHTHQLVIDPEPTLRTSRIDYFGNTVEAFSFNQGYPGLIITSISEVTVTPRPKHELSASPAWELIRNDLASHRTAQFLEASEFLYDSPRVRTFPELQEYAHALFEPERPILEAVSALKHAIYEDFRYDTGVTNVTTPVDEVFEHRHGVCQDFAHVGIALARSVGLAARYVSGYLRTYPPPGQPRLVGADASHAWFAVYCGELGWIDVDPTNDLFPDQEHITLAWGRDYSDVPPVRGVFIGGGRHRLSVSVDVAPLPLPEGLPTEPS